MSTGSLVNFMPIADDFTSHGEEIGSLGGLSHPKLTGLSPFLTASPPRLIEKVLFKPIFSYDLAQGRI